jgi:hypothetical protein
VGCGLAYLAAIEAGRLETLEEREGGKGRKTIALNGEDEVAFGVSN